jgi:hypothetical protein
MNLLQVITRFLNNITYRLESLTGKQAADVKLMLTPQTAALDDHAILDQVGIQEDTGIPPFMCNYKT